MPSQRGPGRSEDFERFYRQHAAAVLAYLARRCPSAADAHDALAETFLVAWRRPEEVPAGDAGRLWLYGVARRVLSNQRRGERRRGRLAARLRADRQEAVVPGPDEVAGGDEVLRALARLSERDREILLLAAWEGLSHGEIATVLGCSENASAIRVHRARGRLRDAYAKEGGSQGTRTGGYGRRDRGEAVP